MTPLMDCIGYKEWEEEAKEEEKEEKEEEEEEKEEERRRRRTEKEEEEAKKYIKNRVSKLTEKTVLYYSRKTGCFWNGSAILIEHFCEISSSL